MSPAARGSQWGSQGGKRAAPKLVLAEAWVWGDEREPSPSPRPTGNLPGLVVRVRLHLRVSCPLWGPGSRWSDDHWHLQSYGGGGVDPREAGGAPGWRLCVTRRLWGCGLAGQGVPVWAQGVPATVKGSPVHLGERRAEPPRAAGGCGSLCGGAGPPEGTNVTLTCG